MTTRQWEMLLTKQSDEVAKCANKQNMYPWECFNLREDLLFSYSLKKKSWVLARAIAWEVEAYYRAGS